MNYLIIGILLIGVSGCEIRNVIYFKGCVDHVADYRECEVLRQ